MFPEVGQVTFKVTNTLVSRSPSCYFTIHFLFQKRKIFFKWIIKRLVTSKWCFSTFCSSIRIKLYIKKSLSETNTITSSSYFPDDAAQLNWCWNCHIQTQFLSVLKRDASYVHLIIPGCLIFKDSWKVTLVLMELSRCKRECSSASLKLAYANTQHTVPVNDTWCLQSPV